MGNEGRVDDEVLGEFSLTCDDCDDGLRFSIFVSQPIPQP